MKGLGRYTKEFKVEAVRLLELKDKPASELAMELGVKRTLLYRWRDQLRLKKGLAFAGVLADTYLHTTIFHNNFS